MIKAAKLTLCVSLLASTALPLHAQTTATDDPAKIAETEAIRRQEATLQMRMKLAEAQSAQRKGQLSEAARLYQDAVSLFPKVQIGNDDVEAQKRMAVAGLSTARLNLAKQANQRGNYIAASEQIALGLKYDPKNEVLLDYKEQLDKAAIARRGTEPSVEIKKTEPQIKNEKLDNATTVQNAKFLYEMGKYDEAEAKLKEVLKRDAGNKAAYYYLDLIKEARYMNRSSTRESEAKSRIADVTKAWIPENKNESLPVPNLAARTNLNYTSEGRQKIMLKLDQIRINEVGYDLPMTEVLKELRKESIKRDPDGVGINFFVNTHIDAATSTTTGNGGLGGAAMMPPVAPGTPVAAGMPGDAMMPGAAATPTTVDFSQITVKIVPAMSDMRLADVLDLLTKVADQPIKYSIEDYGIMFSPKTPEPVQLHSKTFRVDPNTFIQGLASVTALPSTDLSSSGGGGGGGSRGGGSRGGGGNSSNGGYNDGGNISGAAVEVSPSGGYGGGGGMGGNRGGNRGGNMNNAANNAGGGAGMGNGSLYGPGLPFVTANISTLALHDMVRQYFTAAGVDLNPPKSVFFNDRSGVLFVRASLQDLDIIGAAVEALNRAPTQLTIEAKFAEITQDDSRALGFDWMLGNVSIGGNVGAQPGTAPSYQGNPTANNPSGVFPGPSVPVYNSAGEVTGYQTGPGYIAPKASDGLLTSGLRNNVGSGAIPAVATITGILTDPQFRVVIKAIEQRSGTDMLAAPKVTTLSGRQTHIAVQDMITIVTEVNLDNGGFNTDNANSGGGGLNTYNVNQNNSIDYSSSTMAIGPVLDVLPSVSADGYSIQMVLIPTITEFKGYDDPGQFVPQTQAASGGNIGLPLTAIMPLPRIRVRQVVTSCNVWDGQTVVLGGLISENIQKFKDKVPLLGDLPMVGRLFRSESSATTKKNLMIFVTPTLIDPAGNRLHSEEEMPFAKTSVPTQMPVPAAAPAAAQ